MAELQRSAVPVRDLSVVRAAEAVSYLRNLALVWDSPGLTDSTRAELLHAIYERVVVSRDRFVEVQLTPHAYRHGVALALPEVVHWRPALFYLGWKAATKRRLPNGTCVA